MISHKSAVEWQETFKRVYGLASEEAASKEALEACDIAIAAIKRDEAMPVVKTMGDTSSCPNCGMVVKQGNKLKCMYYCHYCGQKLSWED